MNGNNTSPTLELPTVTLCAVDTRSPDLALMSLKRSMAQVRFAQVILFSCDLDPAPLHAQGIELISIPTLKSAEDYSRFVLLELPNWINTDHVLITQWDGFVVNAQAWDPAFLNVDYLGAPWGKAPHDHLVGNGGFSLRSRRLLQALQQLQRPIHHPEDVCICQTHRTLLEQQHGMVFGTLPMAQRFAFENETVPHATFGFHGAFNFPRVLGADDIEEWLRALPSSVVKSRDGYKTARNLLACGQKRWAHTLLRQRRQAGVRDFKSIWLEWLSRD